MRTTPVLLAAILAVLLAIPGAAGAATVLQAVPSGGAAGGTCDAAAPCTLAGALAGASSGDTVRLAAGTYDVATPLNVTVGGLTIEGDAAAAPPLLQWSGSPDASFLKLAASGQTLRRVRVEGGVNGAQTLVRSGPVVTNTTLEGVTVRNAGSGTAVALRDGLLRDSVVVTTGAGGIAAIATGAVTSSTLIADGLGGRALYTSTGYFGGAAAVTVRNTILSGAVKGWDGVADDNDGADGTVAALDVDFSSFGAGRLLTLGGTPSVTTGAANVTTLGPLLAGLPGGLDVHQLRGSPTIDAGSAAPALGERDIDGDVRTYGAATDIGADEYLSPPLASIQTVVVDDTSAAVTGLITPRGSDTAWRLDYGPTIAYGSTLKGDTVPGTVTAQAVSGKLTGLTPGTTYHVRLVGTSPKGTAEGLDVTFRTTSTPGGGAAGAKRPTISGARLVKRSVRRGVPAAVKLRSSDAGSLEIVISRLQRGTRSGGACVAAKARRCTVAVRIGALSRKVLPGENGPLPVITTKLRRARYRLTLSVVGTNGKRSKPATLTLRVR